MSLEQFLIDFHNTDELYQAYMPFLTYGGIFVKTTRSFPMGTEVTLSLTLPDALEPNVIEGTVVWISEQETQSANPCGVGIGFGEGKAQLQARIEKLLGSKLNSGEATFTM
ncbi:MAG: PilZ domain-containing protein [Algicola sp.]|nr:PilZ domain-containing protein [Algicola sp.]